MSDLTFLSASQIAEQIRTRKVSPVEVIEAHLARIENLNPKINAFVQIDRERAVAQARQAETAVIQGKSLGPLHGVPISIKSSIDVAGMRCEAGTKLRGSCRFQRCAAGRASASGSDRPRRYQHPRTPHGVETDNLSRPDQQPL
jgi:aspartyl-tRNA(Asn)/glutamyl-tRNA(Gln) amidotransferase subunit A